MGQRFLIDTCVIVKYLDEELSNEWLCYLDDIMDSRPVISFITEIELLAWKSGTNTKIAHRMYILDGFKKVYINQDIIDQTIHIRREAGTPIPDSIIAATSLSNDLTLITTNNNDFDKIERLGVKYINPEKDNVPKL